MSNVYVMSGGKHIKIGISTDVKKRISAVQTGCPFRVEIVKAWPTNQPSKIEVAAHEVLRKYRTAGEWFNVPTPVGVLVIEALLNRPRFQLKAIVFCRYCTHTKSMSVPEHGSVLRCTKCNKRDTAHVVTF